MRNFVLLAILATASQSALRAQQLLVLNSGVQMEGRYDGGNADTVWFIDDHAGRHRFNITEIQSLVFNRNVRTAAVPGRYVDTDDSAGARWRRHAMVPAGVEIEVRTIEPIDVRDPDPHQMFLASIDRDVRDAGGRVVIPKGAPAHLIVRDVGGGEIAIDLRSVSVNGRRYILNAEDLTGERLREEPGVNSRTAKLVGGGAVLGTILGALAGGGKGAAIGALAGGGAGAATQVLTRGRGLHIPPEAVLRFRLERPIYLYD
jgi:hypothetical protein